MAREKTTKILTKKHLARLEKERIQRRNLLIGAIAIIVLVVGTLAYGLLDQFVLKQYQPVAEVNGDKISLKDFQDEVSFNRWQLIRQYEQTLQIYQMFGSDPNFGAQFQSSLQQISQNLSAENSATLGSSVLDQMISDRLIEQEAKARNITVGDAELETAMQEAFGFFPNGTPTPSATPEVVSTSTLSPQQLAIVTLTATPTEEPTGTPDPTLEVTATPETAATETPAASATPELSPTPLPTATAYTEEGYKGQIATTVAGMKDFGFSEEKLRNVVYRGLLRQKLYEAMTADVQPEQEQVWARHILVQDQNIAQMLYDQLQNGATWDEVVVQIPQPDPESTDSSQINTTEDLGWFSRGQMDPAFEEAAFDLGVGEIGEPVQSSFGWHIIQVIGHEERPLTAEGLATAKQQIFTEWLESAKAGEGVKQYDIWMDNVPVVPTLPADIASAAQ